MIVDLHLKGNLVIVVGAGNEGVKKVKSLLTQDCKILVISNNTNSQISKLVKEKKIKFKKLKLINPNFLQNTNHIWLWQLQTIGNLIIR